MEKIALTDIARVPRSPGEPLVIHPRTDKKIGIDISGNATAEILARRKARQDKERSDRRRKWRLFGK